MSLGIEVEEAHNELWVYQLATVICSLYQNWHLESPKNKPSSFSSHSSKKQCTTLQGYTTYFLLNLINTVLTYQTNRKYSRIQDAHLKMNEMFKYYLSIAGMRKRVPRISPAPGSGGSVEVWGYHSFALSGGRGLPLLCFWHEDRFGEGPEYIKTANWPEVHESEVINVLCPLPAQYRRNNKWTADHEEQYQSCRESVVMSPPGLGSH